MPHKIIDYDCIRTDSINSLTDGIKDRLNEGWELFGDTKFQYHADFSRYFQAFIKVEK